MIFPEDKPQCRCMGECKLACVGGRGHCGKSVGSRYGLFPGATRPDWYDIYPKQIASSYEDLAIARERVHTDRFRATSLAQAVELDNAAAKRVSQCELFIREWEDCITQFTQVETVALEPGADGVLRCQWCRRSIARMRMINGRGVCEEAMAEAGT